MVQGLRDQVTGCFPLCSQPKREHTSKAVGPRAFLHCSWCRIFSWLQDETLSLLLSIDTFDPPPCTFIPQSRSSLKFSSPKPENRNPDVRKRKLQPYAEPYLGRSLLLSDSNTKLESSLIKHPCKGLTQRPILSYTILSYPILSYTILNYTKLYCTILYDSIMLCCITPL